MSTHRPPKSRIIWGLGRIDDSELDEDTLTSPVCSNYQFPTCQKHHARYVQWKCESCYSVGVRTAQSWSDGFGCLVLQYPSWFTMKSWCGKQGNV
jgi:hypothetical protein